MPPAPTRLSAPDLAVVAAYLVAITLFGLRFSRKQKQGTVGEGAQAGLKSYFLADNTIPWWAIALSIVSAETSTLTIVSIPGVAYAGDLGFLQIVLGYMLGRVVVALLFLPKYFRGDMLTAYQLIDQRFGPALHKLTAGLFLATRAAAEGVRVFAISIVVGIAIGTGDTLSIFIISALTLVYTFEGGMAAVIWTDVVQMALYVAGTLIALWTLGNHVPGGWAHIHAVAAPLGKFHWLNFTLNLTTAYTFWAGVLGGTFLTMASHGTDQLMVQRMLAARNLRESRLALLSSGVVIFVQFTLFLLIGIGLYVFYAAHPVHFASADRIFPTFIVTELPHGVAGLLVAAILAAAMSNLSAALNSLASTTVVDFWLPLQTRIRAPFTAPFSQAVSGSTPESPKDQTILVSRAATVFWAIVLFLIAVYSIRAGGKGHVVEIALSIASVAYGCLLGVFLLGTLTARSSRYGATQTGTMIGMLTGFLLNLWLWQAHFPKQLGPVTIPHIAFTWYVLIGALVTFAVGTLFSLILPRRRAATAATVLILLAWCALTTHAQTAQQALLEGTASAVSSEPPQKMASAAEAHAPDFTPVSILLNDAIAAHKLPGAVVVIGHNGHIAFKQAYGNRKLAGEPGLDGKPSPPEPMTEDTIFDMASLTKVIVTTTAILQLYEHGKLDLDTPVAHYLPDFMTTTGASNPPSSPLALSAPSAPHYPVALSRSGGSNSVLATSQSQAWKSRITIRQLLTHYSGLPEDVDLRDPWGLAAPDKAEGIRRALAAVPYGPPAVTFKYSDINFITLGALVEIISGEPLNVYARLHIFTPIAMQMTGYHPYFESCGPVLRVGAAIEPGPRPVGHILVPCKPDTWSPYALDPATAPTAHDNEGTPATNPDFDHLLRGTVHDPTTRRMGGVAGHAGVFSTAADMSLFAQALLDKLLRNTGPFPLRQTTLQMATSPQAAATASHDATIFLPDGTTTKGIAQRGLGWDLNSAFSRPRGTIFPITTGGYGKPGHPGSFGHTGFTGTSLWIDPTSDTYVLLLANAIHPRGAPPISALRGQVATAAAQALGLARPGTDVVDCSTQLCSISIVDAKQPTPFRAPSIAPHALGGSTTDSPTLTGIDVLEATNFAQLKSLAIPNYPLRIALLTNQSGIDAHGRPTLDILLEATKQNPNLKLVKVFTPEHGLYGRQDTEHLTSEQTPTGIPVISLYGSKPADRHPKPTDLADVDVVVIDLQDIGTRFWTYETVLRYFLDDTACKPGAPAIVVLDRPNPINGLAAQGPVSDPPVPGSDPYINSVATPVRHGLTLGELARYLDTVDLPPACMPKQVVTFSEPNLPVPAPHKRLTVIPMQHWHRAEFFPASGLPWMPPSPNMKTPATAVVYPGVALLETTNVSVGRGTAAPYENLGASWMLHPEILAAYLGARHIPGIRFTSTTLTIAETPEHYPGHGTTLPGLHLEVTDRTALDSPEMGVELLSALHKLYPADFQLAKANTILANADTLARITAGEDPRAIAATWAAGIARFRTETAPFLLYPEPASPPPTN